MSSVPRICESEAVRVVGLMNFDQNLYIDCSEQDPNRFARHLKALYKNMGLMLVVYDQKVIYVERPRPKARCSK